MAGLGKITVQTSELITASENVTNLADSYNADYTKLYSLIDELRSSWDGKDNQAYTLQIAEFYQWLQQSIAKHRITLQVRLRH